MSYFKPWRRKLGVVTLLMACVLMAGWMRSSFVYDGVEIVLGSSKYTVSSMKGQTRYSFARSDQARVEKHEIRFPSFPLKATVKSEITGDHTVLALGDFRCMTGAVTWGHYSDLVQTPGPTIPVKYVVAQLPYWSIVLPLALLSAYLLLSKPRVRTPVPENRPA